MGWILGLGNGVVFRTGSSRAWSSYWTPSSAVVENAAPTDIVLTYEKAVNPADAIVGNFSVAGKTISGAVLDGTGKILTLTVTVAFVYGDSITVVANGTNISVTNNITNPEMITNGNFNDGGTAWKILGNDVTISDGRVNYDDSNGRVGGINQPTADMISAIEASTDYILEFDVIISSGNANIWIGNSSLSIGYTTPSYSDYPNGHISIEFKTPSNIGIGGFTMYFSTKSTTSFSIDNISLKLK